MCSLRLLGGGQIVNVRTNSKFAKRGAGDPVTGWKYQQEIDSEGTPGLRPPAAPASVLTFMLVAVKGHFILIATVNLNQGGE